MCRVRCLLLVAVLLTAAAALWIRVPLIAGTSRYFYHEDDGHHFNHTVEMTQAVARRGDFNPHYFNKPSLHFYVRMPVVLASVAWARYRGELESVHDLRTRDPRVAELNNYRWTPSHPTVLQWNRALSIALSVILVMLTAGCAGMLLRSFAISPGGCDAPTDGGLSVGARSETQFAILWVGILAGLVPAFSLEVVRNSHIIGVDVLMALMCLVTTTIALLLLNYWSGWLLAICCLAAGLACSSKYNAAPIGMVPVVAWFVHHRPPRKKLLRCWWIFPVLGCAALFGFLLGTPYALLSFSDFMTGVRYEVWHYGVAGHEGHASQPGFPQALFYLRWLYTDGVGRSVSLLAVMGMVWFLRRDPRRAAVFLAFPILYAVLMVCQKTNFTRNMVVMVPYVGILAGLGGHALLTNIASQVGVVAYRRYVVFLGWVLLLAVSTYPLFQVAQTYVDETIHHPDSRDSLAGWLGEKSREGVHVAVSGRLHLPLAILQLPGVDSFQAQRASFDELKRQGYGFIVLPLRDAQTQDASQIVSEEFSISGEEGEQRIPDNPAIVVYRIVS
jgi:hypothetical protein